MKIVEPMKIGSTLIFKLHLPNIYLPPVIKHSVLVTYMRNPSQAPSSFVNRAHSLNH